MMSTDIGTGKTFRLRPCLDGDKVSRQGPEGLTEVVKFGASDRSFT